MDVDGMGFRQFGRHLQVDHVTVMNWGKIYASRLAEAAVPKDAYAVEMDELYTFIGKKKNRVYVMTFVDRDTRCILARKVGYRRSGYEFQEMLAHSVQGHDYYSDDYQGYKTVLYSPAIHHPMKDKSQTYSIEGSNADLRQLYKHRVPSYTPPLMSFATP